MDKKLFTKLILSTNAEKDINEILNIVLGYQESKNIEMRIKILKLLSLKKSYQEIERETGASSATIAKINAKLNSFPSIQRLINRIRI